MGQPTSEVAARRSPAGAERAARHPALALTALLGAMFLANVDVAIANVAAPSIKAGLHAGGGELELVVSGYMLAGPVSGTVLMTLLGVTGLGLGAEFTGMIGHLANSVTAERAADVSGLFNTAARGGAVIGTAVFGTVYLALVHHRGQATHGFAVVCLALAGTALAAAAMAGVSVRRSR